MKFVAIAIMAFFCLNSALAAGLAKGDWEINGGLSVPLSAADKYMGWYTPHRNRSVLLNTQYFWADKLTVGAEVEIYRGIDPYNLPSENFLVWKLSPIMSYYFLTSESIAPFVTLAPIKETHGPWHTSNFSSGLRAGAKFFVTDKIAITPALDYERHWEWSDYDTFSGLALFSLSL